MCQSRDSREYWAADSPIARIAQHDAEPAAGALESVAFVFVAHRERANDAFAGNLGEDFRGAQRWVEPFFHTGIRRRGAARGSVHPGVAPVPTSAGLGTVAIHIEAPAGHQR